MIDIKVFAEEFYLNYFQGKIIELCIEYTKSIEIDKISDEIDEILDYCITEKPYVSTPRLY